MTNCYVVYMWNVDRDCPKKTDCHVIGVFDTKRKAKFTRDFAKMDHEEHPYDDRCLNFRVKELGINKINESYKNYDPGFCSGLCEDLTFPDSDSYSDSDSDSE